MEHAIFQNYIRSILGSISRILGLNFEIWHFWDKNVPLSLDRVLHNEKRVLSSSQRNFNVFPIHCFKIVSRYPYVIAVVSSCTYIAITLTFTIRILLLCIYLYARLVLNVRGELLLDSSLDFSYWNRYVTEIGGLGVAKDVS